MKKTKIAGIFALILAVILILPYITSCTIDEETKNANSNEDGADANYANSDEGEIETNTVKIIMNDFGGVQTEYVETLKQLIYDNYGMNAEITVFSGGMSAGYERINTKLLAGDNDFDIYMLGSANIPYHAKVGACLDLSSAKGIIGNFDNMFDGLKELCSAGGKLCGVPLYLNIPMMDIWDCNIELAEKLGIYDDIVRLSTQKMTFQEFYDFAVETKEKAELLGIENFYVLSTGFNYIDHRIQFYMTNYLDYTAKKIENKTSEYIAYLNLYSKMIDDGLIKLGGASNATGSVLFGDTGVFNYINCNRQPFPIPLITANDSYLVDPTILAINPKSPNINSAKKYLEYAISIPVQQKMENIYLLKDRTLYDAVYEESLREKNDYEEMYRDFKERNEEQFGEQLEERFKEFYINVIKSQMQRVIPTTNGQEVIAFIIKNGKALYMNGDIWDEMVVDAVKMMNYEMTPEDFVQKLYNKSKMIIEE